MKFLIEGREIPEADVLTLGDMRDVKRISGLVGQAFVDAISASDPDAFIAYAFVSARNVLPHITVEDIEALDVSTFVIDDDDEDTSEADAAPLGESSEALEPSATTRAKRSAKPKAA